MSEKPEDGTQQESTSNPGSKDGAQQRIFKGRMRITTSYEEITKDNVIEVLQDSIPAFGCNSGDIHYLWNYYKGRQPILNRVKQVRPEINNKIVENHAQEIVAFKLGYQLAEPLQYTCRNGDDDADYEKRLKQIDELNTYMFAEDKASCDRDLFEWMLVGGQGYRMTVVDSEFDEEEGGAPFEFYTLDPRFTFVVYSSAYHGRPLMAVWVAKDVKTGITKYNVYTDSEYFLIEDNRIIDEKPHTYKRIPIVEYPLNNARMGVFEPVLPLLDAINAIESNRLDDIEQTVQALLVFTNVDIDAEGFKEMIELGAVKVTSREGAGKSSVDVISNDLDQEQTQVTKDDMYQAIVNICGMPNRNGTSGSSSDTGAAVLLRDGWTLAESHAKSYELQFKRAERNMLRVVLEICKQSRDCSLDLRIRDIELAFNRRNYENILVKAQVLTTMLKSGKIHPQLAFESCGLFTDPEAAYIQSKSYEENNEAKAQSDAVGKDALGGIDDNDPDDAAVSQQQGVGSQAGVPEPKQ